MESPAGPVVLGGKASGPKNTQHLWYPREIYLFPPIYPSARKVPTALQEWVQQYQQAQVYQAEQKLFQELSSATRDRARLRGDT